MWEQLYIIEGTITVFVGIIIVCFLPDFPDSWKLLSPEMKHVANRRMALDASEADTDGANKMDHWTGLKQAFADPKTYILAISYHGIVAASGFQNVCRTSAIERVLELTLSLFSSTQRWSEPSILATTSKRCSL